MTDFILPLVFLAVVFVGFGLVHRNQKGAGGCAGCTSCADKSQCKKDD